MERVRYVHYLSKLKNESWYGGDAAEWAALKKRFRMDKTLSFRIKINKKDFHINPLRVKTAVPYLFKK